MIDEYADHQGIEYGHCPRFRRGENPAHDPADDDDRHEESQYRIFPSGKDFMERSSLLPSYIMSLLPDDVAVDHQADAHQDTGNDPADEQGPHTHIGQCPIDQQGDGRRDDRPDRTTAGQQRCAEGIIISLFLHQGNHDAPNGCRCRNGRTGNGSKEHTGQDTDHSQPTGEMAQQRISKIHQPLGHPAPEHQFAREHEQGDSNEGNAVDPAEHPLDHDQQVEILVGQGPQGDQPQSKRNGDSQ